MRRVTVTHTPDVLTDATADLAWALILACARQVVPGAALVASGSWTGWHPELLLGLELRGRTLGLFGAGRIGQAVGRRAVPFGMRILYTARTARLDFERETGAARVERSTLFKESDVLSLHAPSVPETKGIINADTLRQMKPGAILINTARGDLVREEALAQALEEGRLGGAGLDVYLEEPAVHARLRAAPRAWRCRCAATTRCAARHAAGRERPAPRDRRRGPPHPTGPPRAPAPGLPRGPGHPAPY